MGSDLIRGESNFFEKLQARHWTSECWIFLQCLWSESWMPVLWLLRSDSTFTFFGILSEIETFIVSSTKSVEATTSRDPVKGTDFLTCSATNWYKTSLLPLVKLLAYRGAWSPWAC